MNKRKPIHIAMNAEGDLLVLCDDGSLWYEAQGAWDLLADNDDFNPPPAPEEDVKVWQFIVNCLKAGRKQTKQEIEGQSARMGLSRKKVRAALIRLRLKKCIQEDEFPEPEKQGMRRTYIKPMIPPPPVSENQTHCHPNKAG